MEGYFHIQGKEGKEVGGKEEGRCRDGGHLSVPSTRSRMRWTSPERGGVEEGVGVARRGEGRKALEVVRRGADGGGVDGEG